MKSRIIQIPKVEKKISHEEQIIKILSNISLTANQIGKKIPGYSMYNLRPLLSNMIRDGILESHNCSHCDIGTMYKVKK